MVDSLPFALTGGLFSRSPAAVDLVAARTPVGNLYVNRGITGAMVGRQPFGGNRRSGIGSKAGGPGLPGAVRRAAGGHREHDASRAGRRVDRPRPWARPCARPPVFAALRNGTLPRRAQPTRSHLTRNAIAYLALFVALGGTSYGLAAGSIDSREIKNDTIRTGDLRNNEVRSRDIRNRTIVGPRPAEQLARAATRSTSRSWARSRWPPASKSADDALSLGGLAASGFAPPAVAVTADVPTTTPRPICSRSRLRHARCRGQRVRHRTRATESFALRYVEHEQRRASRSSALDAADRHRPRDRPAERRGGHRADDDAESSHRAPAASPADGVGTTPRPARSSRATTAPRCRVSLQVSSSAA